MKLVFIDVETTGTNFWQHGIHQLSGCIEIGGEVVDRFDYRVAPNPAAKIEQAALDVAGVTVEQIQAYTPMRDIYREFVKLLSKHVDKYDRKDKAWFVGYNRASFDMPFVRAWFKQNGDEYFGSWFYSVSIDCIVLAAQQLMGERREMEDFKLHTVAKKLGISVDETRLHDAEYDIDLTRRIYQVVTGLKAIKETIGPPLTCYIPAPGEKPAEITAIYFEPAGGQVTDAPTPVAASLDLLDQLNAATKREEYRYCRNCGRDHKHQATLAGTSSAKLLFWECTFCHEHGDAVT